MTLYKNVNGVDVPLNSQEIEEYSERETAWQAAEESRLIARYTELLSDFIELKAKEKGYSSAVSCTSYSLCTNVQWAAEANAFIAWRDLAFEYAFDYLEGVQSGEIINPTPETFLAGLPSMIWPEPQPL